MKTSELVAYVQHYQALRRDLAHVLADHETEKSWTTHYAADFSEIYAFTLPYESHESTTFGDAWGAVPLRQFYVLARILGQGEIILLDSYALELRSFFDRLIGRSLNEEDQLRGPMDHLKEVLQGTKAKWILELAARAEQNVINPDEVRRTLLFFEENSPALVAMVQGGAYKPIDRLKRLLRRRPFRSLNKVAPDVPAQADELRVREIYRLLEERRPDAPPVSLYNDALAIEHVTVANRILAPKKERIVLISRSPTMMAVLEDLYDQGKTEGVEPFIRHPRIFSAGYRVPPNGKEREWLDDLRLRQGSLQVFLDIARYILPPDPATRDAKKDEEVKNSNDLEAAFKRIRDEWSKVEALATAVERKGEIELEKAAADPAKIARDLLEFLRDPKRHLYKRAISRIREIFFEVQRERELLAIHMPDGEPRQESARIFYPIEFKAPPLEERMSKLSGRWSVTISEAKSLFDLLVDESAPEYERLLAIAVSAGAIGQWRVATRFAKFALEVGQQTEGLSLHEGHFFHAVCMRKNSRRGETAEMTAERVWKALKELQIAMRFRKGDPRYLTEYAAQLLYILEARDPKPQQALDVPLEIARALRQARRGAADDRKLLTQINNDRAYLYIALHTDQRAQGSVDTERNLRRAERALRDLEKALGALGSTDWPAFIEDTVVWGKFVLHGEDADAPLDDWLERLRKIAQKPDLSPNEHELVLRHRQAVLDRKVLVVSGRSVSAAS